MNKKSLALLGAGGVLMMAATGSALAGISNTKHNLTLNTNANYVTAGTGEICVFCHTPHAATAPTTGPLADPAAPLWNKKLNTAGTYTTYSSNTMDANTARDGATGSTSIGSVSLACLSCHDGTQAMDNMINQPGFGGINSNGARLSGVAWTMGRGSAAAGTLGNGTLNGFSTGAMLGTDLSNDHPIGVAYCAGTLSGSTWTCNDKDFVNPQVVASGGSYRAWVDTTYQVSAPAGGNIGNTGGTKERTDMILYTRYGASSITMFSVECASCHDPHVEAKGTNQVAFLRVSQASSGVCLACHAK